MRFSAQLPTDRVDAGSELIGAEAIGEIAPALENAGFDACYVTEHPFPPDDWLKSGGHHALDPFVSLTAAAMVTTRLRLHTNILVLTYRNPFLLAKAVASLDVMSGGRVIMGVAAGYLEGEFLALGADFEDRNDLGDDSLEAMIEAWTTSGVKRRGPGYEAVGNSMEPAPKQSPHPPIWVGGNSLRAMRRAVRFAQGWSPFPLPRAGAGRTHTAAIETIEDLAARIVRLKELAEEAGRREPLDVNFVPFGMRMNAETPPDFDALSEQMDRLEEIGVTWVSLGIPGRSRTQVLESVAAMGEWIAGRRR